MPATLTALSKHQDDRMDDKEVLDTMDDLIEQVENLISPPKKPSTRPVDVTVSVAKNDHQTKVTCFEFEEDDEEPDHFPKELVLKKRKVEPTLKRVDLKKSRIDMTASGDRATQPVIGYIFSPSLLAQANRLPAVKGRAFRVHALIEAFDLLPKMRIIQSRPSTEEDLTSFHSKDYINYIKDLDSRNSEEPTNSQEDGDQSAILDVTVTGEDFGLAYDCYPFVDMMTCLEEVSGSTQTAIKSVLSGEVSVAINWFGGWHHSKTSEASGYCYVNDIVIGILDALRNGLNRVLYVDFDLHHGDAVQDAFYHSNKVMTVSFHKHEVGFFPGTGSISDIGIGRGLGYSVNVPLKDGMADEKYIPMAKMILSKVVNAYQPELIVAQFGADGIAGDPMKSFNLTPTSMSFCLNYLLSTKVPLVILGGGGYNPINVAKTWTYLTATTIGVNIPSDSDIPEEIEFFPEFGPSFEMSIKKSCRDDQNDNNYLKLVVETIERNLSTHVSGKSVAN